MGERSPDFDIDLTTLEHVESNDEVAEGLYKLDMAWANDVGPEFMEIEQQLRLRRGSLTPLLEKVDRHVRDWRELVNMARVRRGA